MEAGNVLIYLALGAALGSVLFTFLTIIRNDQSLRRLARWLNLLSFLFLTLIVFLIIGYFLSSDLHLQYIWENTDSSYEWYYKLVGLWTGIEGTLLLWTWLISMALVVEESIQVLRQRREDRTEINDPDEELDGNDSMERTIVFDWTRLIALILLIAFIGLMISSNMFKSTEDITIDINDQNVDRIIINPSTMNEEMIFVTSTGERQTIDPDSPGWARPYTEWVEANYGYLEDGLGINHLLLTPLMIIHPPVEFVAYAFTTIILASAMAFLITGNNKWTEVSLRWGRLAWLFYTLGLGLGALWAYVVLGWGGYWAWDPVETANLVPWIALTAFLHAQLYNKRRGDFQYIAPLLAVSIFVLTLLSRFITKSGVWLESVHTYLSGSEGLDDPVERLNYTLQNNDTTLYLFLIMVLVLLIALILFSWRFLQKRLADPQRSSEITKATAAPMIFYILFMIFITLYLAFDTEGFINGAAEFSETLGNGKGFTGAVILSILAVAFPVGWMIYTGDDDKDRGIKRSFKSRDEKTVIPDLAADRLTRYLTVTLLSVGVIAVTSIMLLGVNGLSASDFDSRAPYIVLPLIGVLIACLAWRSLGFERILYLIGTMIFVGILGFFIYPDSSLVGFGLPVLFIALIITGFKIIRSTIARKLHKMRMVKDTLTIAGALLIIAGIFEMVLWSAGVNPYWPVVLTEPTLLVKATGFTISIIAIIAGVSIIKSLNFEFGLIGTVCGIISMGLVIGAVLSALTLFLIFMKREDFSEGLNFRPVKNALRPLSAHLIHLGVVLVLIGYVGTNNLEDEKDINPLFDGDTASINDYTLEFHSSTGKDIDGITNTFEYLEVVIEIKDNGNHIGYATIIWEYVEVQGYYSTEVSIQSTLARDVYITSYGFFTDSDGWISAMSQTPNQRFTSDEISGIAFKVKLIPLISPIWGGLWLAVTGIFLRMGTDYWPSRRRKDMTDHLEEKEARNVIHKRDKDESYYEDLLELELAEMDGSKARTGTVRRNGQSGVQKRPSTSRREKRRRV